jgi:phosphotransferase system enzyme I (PtsI)
MSEKNEKKLNGIPAAPGITIAKAFLYTKDIESISSEKVSNIEEAKQNLHDALKKSKKELNKIFDLAVDKLGDKRAAIFEAQIMILEDQVLLEKLYSRIENEKISPEFIVDDEITKYQNMMSASKEFYMKERSRDIEDIKFRIIRNLKNKKWKSRIKSDVIVVTESITPADTVLFTRVNVKGYITNFGGLTSHGAIVARSLNIPAVLGVQDATAKIDDDSTVILDGFHGTVIVNPTDEQINYYNDKIEKVTALDTELIKLKDEPAVTKDGFELKIQANLDVEEEIEFIVQNGAKGIGLIRTEQLYNVLENFPEEEVQLEQYNNLAAKLYPETITIRAFDIGGDKVLPVDVKEPNPMLGWRGIRFLLDHKELFKTQMRAVLRAAIHNNIRFMIPMVTSLAEIQKTKLLLEECKQELKNEGLDFNSDLIFGVMIEVPSASLLLREFGEEVSFFSIGTNDLIQYLLAVDRGNEIINDLYQEFHPAVIRALDYMVRTSKITKTPISICGEMAADHYAIPIIVGLGFDSISVNASSIPYLKKIIRAMNYNECKILTEQCLKLSTEKAIKNKIYKFYNERFTEDIDKIFNQVDK